MSSDSLCFLYLKYGCGNTSQGDWLCKRASSISNNETWYVNVLNISPFLQQSECYVIIHCFVTFIILMIHCVFFVTDASKDFFEHVAIGNEGRSNGEYHI